MMKSLLPSLFMLAALSMPAAELPRVFNAPGSPLTITSFEVDFVGDAPRVKLWVRNHTAEPVDEAIVEVFALNADREVEALYSFSVDLPVAPGDDVLVVRRGGLLDFTREQSIVAMPALAVFAGRRWEIPAAVAKTLVSAGTPSPQQDCH